jgi:hypothetical protein
MPESSPTVIVKLADDLASRLPYQDDLISVFPEHLRAVWAETLPDVTLDRGLPDVDAGAVRLRLDENERDNGTTSHNLLGYFTMAVADGADGDALADAALSLPFVEHAYVSEPFTLAQGAVNFGDDPLVVGQGYLAPAPVGINAFHAWTKSGGDGAGVKFVDIEHGFLLAHEDLVAPNGAPRISLLPFATPSTSPEHLEHSTNVLGVVMAADNDRGVVGVAPNAQGFAACVLPSVTGIQLNAALVKIWLNPMFGAGTIVLIELQDRNFLPVETDLFVRRTIAELTRSGLTVIEPAGNGPHNLDTVTDGPFGEIFRRTVFDSGAVMVAAATAARHSRLACHGDRVDCFAWGELIVTTSATTTPPNALNGYTNGTTVKFFQGSSGASAIVAGAALALQGMHLKRHGTLLLPIRMRELLSNIDFNTVPAVEDFARIGVMPDLQRLALEIGVT